MQVRRGLPQEGMSLRPREDVATQGVRRADATGKGMQGGGGGVCDRPETAACVGEVWAQSPGLAGGADLFYIGKHSCEQSGSVLCGVVALVCQGHVKQRDSTLEWGSFAH